MPRGGGAASRILGLVVVVTLACALPFMMSGFRVFQFTQVYIYAIALLGLTSKTTRIIASATVSLSSVPMNFTYVPTRFSITPTRSPPSTAPPGLVKPPSVAEAKA